VRLSTRLSLTVTSVVAATLGIAFFAIVQLVVRDEIADLDAALSTQAEAASALIRATGPQPSRLPEGLAQVPEILNPVTRNMAVYDAAGIRRLRTTHFDAAPAALRELGETATQGEPVDLDGGEEPLRAIALPIPGTSETLLYAVSRRAVDWDRTFLIRTLVVIYVATVAGSALVARWLGAHLSADVTTLAGVARRVANGDLAARANARTGASTETRNLAFDLDHMIEQIAELVSSQRLFVARAAHELRSPLTTILGEIQLSLRRPRTTDEYQRMLTQTLADVDDMVHLAEDLLTLARAQAGTQPGARVAAEAVVSDAIHDSRGLAEAYGVRVELLPLERWTTEAEIRGVRSDIARSLRNLVDNAISHSLEGGVVSVRLTRRRSDALGFEVTDGGCGIDPEEVEDLFKPFFRGARRAFRDSGGSGLGLAIARATARACGGDVVLDSTGERGSTFTLEMPIVSSACRTSGARAADAAAREATL
jgi:two-component system heavy metal sensor histidine kinase CusS